jgi:hypothetical protein
MPRELAKGHEEAAIDLLTVSPILANVELDEPPVAAGRHSGGPIRP